MMWKAVVCLLAVCLVGTCLSQVNKVYIKTFLGEEVPDIRIFDSEGSFPHKVVAKQDIKKGKVLATYNTRENAFASYSFGKECENRCKHLCKAVSDTELDQLLYRARDALEEHHQVKLEPDYMVLLKLVLFRQKHPLTVDSPFRNYIDSLPSNIDSPLFWDRDTFNLLKGSPVYANTQQVKQAILENFEKYVVPLQKLMPEDFGALSTKKMRWAMAIWKSRLYVSSDSDSCESILPIFEIFQFGLPENVNAREKTGQKDVIELVASKDIKKGHQVVIKDVPFTNGEMLEYFGYVWKNGEEENTNDYYFFGVGFKSSDDLYQWKLSLLKSRGLHNGMMYRVKDREPIDADLLFALRLYHMTIFETDDENALRNNKIVSLQNERSVFEMLVSACQGKLSSYPTFLSDDEEELEKELAATKKNQRKINALRVIVSEKRILEHVMEESLKNLEVIASQWAYRSFDIPDNQQILT